METLQDIFGALLTLLLCASPFIAIVVVGGVIALLVYLTKKQRAEKLQAVVDEVSDVSLPKIHEVIESGADSSAPLTRTLVDGAQLIQRLTTGDIAPLEKRRLTQFAQSLRSYEQRAAFGELPEDQLDIMREEDLRRIESLASSTTQLIDSAEEGDAESLRQHLREVGLSLPKAYSNHIAFRRELAEAEVQFPLPQPKSYSSSAPGFVPQSDDQIVAQMLKELPTDKQTLFIMQYNNARKNPNTAVLLAALLGGVGAHKFYMGQAGLGVLYLLFSWTYIPMIVGVVEAFSIKKRVREYNAQKALEIAQFLK